ncbi:MAG: hypothetical protein MAG451_01549 [Anaerolineales bacterium]|nr:hypothetical protein [Anaerolineales bacterium]
MSEGKHCSGDLGSGISAAEELHAAREVSEQVDDMLAGRPVTSHRPELVVAQRLSQLGHLLPPVAPAFERRVLAPAQRRERRWPGLRFPVRAFSLAAVATAVVLILVLTAPGQTALARLAAIFHLESVDVGINVATATPAGTYRVVAPRVERPLGGLDAVQGVAPVPVLAPSKLPAGWALWDARAIYYPDLPASVPLNIILTYADVATESASGASLEIVEYFIQLGDNLTIDSLRRADRASASAREMTIDGRRVILIEDGQATGVRTLIWQQDDILVEVEASGLSAEDLLSITASLQPID